MSPCILCQLRTEPPSTNSAFGGAFILACSIASEGPAIALAFCNEHQASIQRVTSEVEAWSQNLRLKASR